MEKIIVLFNGVNAPWHITTFALDVAKQNGAHIQALFLKDETESYPYPSDIDSAETKFSDKNEAAADNVMEDKNIHLFKTFCDEANVICYFEKNVSIKQLQEFSKDANLVVADSHDDLKRYSLQDILTKMMCPLCLISINTKEIKNSILLYDETENAFHATDAYHQLFPELSKGRCFMVTVNPKANEEDREAAINKMKEKFPNVEVRTLAGDTDEMLIGFLEEHTENTMVVMGAYGRSAISMLFKQSLANVILKQSRISLFIAHD